MTAQMISWWGFVAITIILLGFAALVLWKVFRDPHALDGLLSEPPDANGLVKASLSRFQFLIFTFVIAGLYLLLCIEAGTFIEIPGNVLALLGISGGTFVASKTVTSADQKAKAEEQTKTAQANAVAAAAATPVVTPVIVTPAPAGNPPPGPPPGSPQGSPPSGNTP